MRLSKTRTLRRRVEEEQWDLEVAKSIKGEPRQLVPGINKRPRSLQKFRTEQECAWKKISRLLVWLQQVDGMDPPEAREVSMPPDRLVTQVRSDALKRMYVTRGLRKKYGPTLGCPGCATVGSHHQASHSNTCREQDACRTGKE